jgi:hypothetical protein
MILIVSAYFIIFYFLFCKLEEHKNVTLEVQI